VRRVADFLVRNWPLKVGAILLATVLYSGLVLGQNVRTWTGTLPVDGIRPPAGATLLSDLDPVTQVRYRAPLDVGVVSPDSFRATVDLSRVEPTAGGAPVDVLVAVIALDQRIQIVDYQPRSVSVRLDPVETRQVPVSVSLGTVPDGLNLGTPQIEPSTVTVRGAGSRVDQVTAVVARVSIDASALNIDREFDLIAVDSNGNQVPNVQVEPQRARIRIAVARELATRTLPVVPQVAGQPASGYRITSVTVEPLVVTVSGEEATVTSLETAPTESIDISGRTDDLEAVVRIVLPESASVSGGDTIRVMITIDEDTGSRTFFVGVRLEGHGGGCQCAYEYDKQVVEVILGGPVTTLGGLDPFSLVGIADVSRLSPGSHVVPLSVTPPDGIEVLDISPLEVNVTVVTTTPVPGPT